jgi:hypothetical protein
MYRPNFTYYQLDNETLVAEIHPGDNSPWPFHFLVYCLYDRTSQTWKLYQNKLEDLETEAPDLESAQRKACRLLVDRLEKEVQLSPETMEPDPESW